MFPRTGNGFPLRGGIGFFPAGERWGSPIGGFCFFPKGEVCTCPDGRGNASQDAGWFIAAPSRREDSRPLPGPPIVPHPRKRLAASATGGAAPLSPHFLFLVAPKRENGPCTVQKRKSAKAEHTGDSNTGACRESPRGAVYISARDRWTFLLCGGGWGRRASVSRIFRELVEVSSSPGPSSPVLRPSSPGGMLKGGPQSPLD